MELESEKEDSVIIVSGNVIPNAYQVINTYPQFANTIFVFGAPSPPLIESVQVPLFAEPERPQSWFKRIAKMVVRRGRSSKSKFFEKDDKNSLSVRPIIYQLNITNTMNVFGPLYNHGVIISQDIHKENHNKEHQDKQETESKDSSDNDDHVDNVNIIDSESNQIDDKTVMKKDNAINKDSHPTFRTYITKCNNVESLIIWLRDNMSQLKSPKEKLMYLRAAYEAGYFTKLIPYEVYISEFGNISKSRYYVWMGNELRYKQSDLDAIIGQMPK